MSWFGYLNNQPSDSGQSNDSGANSRPRRNNRPPVNYAELSEEEDLESGLNFDSPLTSPGRPAQSPSVSPRALLIPDPPTTEEVLVKVNEKLSDFPVEEIVETGLVSGEKAPVEVDQPPSDSDNEEEEDAMADFDQQNEDDSATAMDNLRTVVCPYNKEDIVFWFSQLEDQLTLIGVKKQWTKKIALVRFLPPEVQIEVKSLLIKSQTAAGADIYFRIKKQLLKLFGPKPEDAYMQAKNRVLTGKPSQLGKLLVEDLCTGDNKLDGCHCANIVWGMFREKIPIIIRNHIADMPFNKDTYELIFDKADQVWDSNRESEPLPSRQVAATTTASTEVAAVQRGNGQGQGQNKKNKNKNKGQNGAQSGQNGQNGQPQQNKNKGQESQKPKTPVNEDSLCKMHAKWKENATFCAAPWACRMKNVWKAPQ